MTTKQHDELDEILEGYYKWCTNTITDSFKLERIPGLGKAKELKPSVAKAQLTAYINREIVKELEQIYDQWYEEGGRKIGQHIKNRIKELKGYDK